jgi:hypothetical protein
LEQRTKNSNVAFGNHVPVIDDYLNKTPWKGHRPIGPLGSYIKLRPEHEKYTGVIESLISRHLQGMDNILFL